jgi:alkyldihydroxyacetonephosphate synthase
MTIERSKIRWNGWGWTAHQDALAGREEVWSWLASELGMPALLATPARALDTIALPPPKLSDEVRAKFAGIVGAERIRSDDHERAFHALGKSYHDLLRLRAGDLSLCPDAVIYPQSAEEVLRVLHVAAELGVAVVPYGGGSSVVGGVSAARGSLASVVTLDLTDMDRLIDIDPMSLTARFEAGIYGPALEKALAAKGFTLGHFPQSFEFSTLGGWIAHRGAGQGSRGYGRSENWLAGAKLATPRGLLSAGGFPSSAAGPQLLDLVLGSEGAFGVLVEATVRIRPAPKTSDYRGYLFRDFASGASAIREATQAGVAATMLRLSDAAETRFYRAFGALGKRKSLKDRMAQVYLDSKGFDDKACAMIAGFEGEPGEVETARRAFNDIAKKHRALKLGQGQGRRWKEGRFHGPYVRDPMLDRGAGVDTLETATRWSNIDTLHVAVRDAIDKAMRETAPREGAHGVVQCHISHAYPDGASLYYTYIFPRALEREVEQWRAIKAAASDAIVANGGTISHHHGVGEDHLPWLAKEKGALGIDVLRAVKMALDPNGVMNPGKLILPAS